MNGLFNPSTTTKNIGSFSLSSTLPADRGSMADRQTGKINWYKQTLLFAFLMICSTFIAPQQSYGQFDFSHLDSLRNNFPPDSTYSPNRMIVRFKPQTLDLDQLCFTYETVSENGKKVEGTLMSDNQYYNLRTYLGSQRFYVKDLLTDTLLANFMISIGADTLSRMTFASPCVDTVSITRHGDTIPIHDYLFMVLHFKNDTSIIIATYVLNALFNQKLEFAHPDIYLELAAITPNDFDFGKQKAFTDDYTNVTGAWDYEIGNRGTRIAIIDDGIDYTHCEFDQSVMNDNKKIVWGWSYTTNDNNIKDDYSYHGTYVAGIIGGLSNRSTCPAGGNGIAGINGGWGDLGGLYDDLGYGASIIGYRCGFDNNIGPNYYISYVAAAILDASNKGRDNSKYGKGVHFINVSLQRLLWRWGTWLQYDPTPSLLKAVNNAFENKVLFVAPRGNYGNHHPVEPACYEVNKVFSVGGSRKWGSVHEKSPESSNSRGMDIIAPDPKCNFDPHLLWTTYNEPQNYYGCPGSGTSFSAPQVTGIASLLHSYMLSSGKNWKLHPEDYEGILKVAANDINHDPNGEYKDHYDNHSGWGLVNAKNIFIKIVDEGYELQHFSTDNSANITYEPWSHRYKMYIDNSDGEKDIPSGLYEVQRRKVTYTVSHPNTWYDRLTWNNDLFRNVDYKIYVWGNGGNKHDKNTKRGLSYTGDNSYNFQTGYTGVISGYGGNEEAEHNMIHDYETHGSNSHTFSFNNYQYVVYTNSGAKYIPLAGLAGHYSVFAKPIIPTSVMDEVPKSSFEVFPTIVNLKLYIKNLDYTFNSTIYVLNHLGVIVKEVKSIIGVNTIDVSNLPMGTYYVKTDSDLQNVQKFIIVR